MYKKKIKVLIIDDSALVRDILEKGLSADPEIEVIGKAPDVYVARDKIVYRKPDVLTLDIEMPRMDGIDFLKKLMPQYPLPVVMVSSMTVPGARITLEALEHGAVDFVLKPSTRIGSGLSDMMKELTEKIKVASKIDVSKWKHQPDIFEKKQKQPRVLEGSTDKVIAIGASTGGTVALTRLLSEFPPDIPGTVIVQHMPPGFTKMFADRLNDISNVEVSEAVSGDRIVRGRVLIAPGGYHMEVIRSGGNYLVECVEGDKVNGHIPSVDIMFDSVARNVGSNALAVILTGMGRDGATGMLNIKRSGGRTVAQDEESSVVYGMPKEAFDCGGAERLVSLSAMTQNIQIILKEMR